MREDLTTPRLPRQAAGLRLRRDDDPGGDASLVDSSGTVRCALNATALALWQLCDGTTAPAEMVDAICLLCGVPAEMASEDVARTLDALAEAGVVEWVRQ
jgi:pyrroloquinoline quinone biosynthesis protein D